jgi:filamentous hemagglutinin
VVALVGVLVAFPGQAQIAGAPNVPGNLRPTVLVAPNGTPLINIQTPSAAGVSRNVYSDFNVGTNGAILNNSRSNVQTQLGGIVQGNPYLATGSARIILNEVNSGNPSQLRGYIEVGGQRAEVVIANPAGINVDGAGFINASRTTLTTGTPQFNAYGGLDSFLVRGGTITINGAGFDASKTDYAAVLARAVEANAGIWATELKVVTGADQISADHSQITPIAGTGAAPTFALDVAALGGMFAGKIFLVGTEAGLGVRNAGSIQAAPGATAFAGAGQLIVTSAGRLENIGTIQATADANLSATALANSGMISSGSNLRVTTQGNLTNALNGTGGTLEAQGVQLASTAGDIDNRGGTIRQTSGVALNLAAPTLSNTSGGVIGLEPAPAPAPTAGTGGTTSTGSTSGGTTGTGSTSGGTTTTTSGTTSTTTTTTAPAPPPIEPGTVTAAGAILNDGGKIYAGGPITLQTVNLINNGGRLSVASMALSQPSFSNHGGTLNVSGAFTGTLGTFDNSAGTLNAGSLDIATSGDFVNTDGVLTSATDANLSVGGALENTRGTITATGALTANVAGAVQNTSGTLASNQALTLTGQSLNNSQGNISSAGGNVQLGIGQQLLNTDGHIASGANLAIQTGSLEGTNGSLQSTGDLSVTAAQGLTATGATVAGGNATLQGASVDLSGSQTGASNIAITATQGDVTTSGATVATPGTLAVTANAQPGQTLVNSAGQLNAGQLQIGVSNLANTNGGEIVQTGTGATTLATSGTLNNDGGRIASNGQDLTLQAASITSTGGTIEHAGTGTLTIAGGSYSGANGTITGNGALKVAMSGDFNQNGGTTTAQQVTIDTGSLSNRSGQITQTGTGDTHIATAGALDNSAGRIASNGQNLGLQAASITNTAGKIEHAGTGTLSIAGGSYSGANGQITANGALSVAMSGAFNQDGGTTYAQQIDVSAGSLSNQGGSLVQAGSGTTTLAVGGLLNNNAGTIASNGPIAASAGSMSNQGGTLQAAGTSDLSLTVAGPLDNSAGGKILAGGNATVAAGSLNNNAGSVTAVGDLTATIGGAATNVGGTLAANGNTTVTAANLDNSGGTTAAVTGNTSGTNQGIEGTNVVINAATLANQGGAVHAAQDLTVTSGGTVDNSAGGLLSAGGSLRIIDPNAANPGAKTLSVINTAGTLVATNDLQIDAANFSNDGSFTAGGDLSILLTQDIVNNRDISASGNLTYGTTGQLTNNAKLLAGDTLTVNGNVVDNTATGEMSGTNTAVNAAATLTNRGLIDSQGATQINAGTLNNIGTGRLYGDQISIGVGTLNNTKEELPGIFCHRDADGQPLFWTAHTQCAPDKRLQKAFSVSRYGERARDMAIRERERQLTQMRGIVFGLLDAEGRQLLEQHADLPEPVVIEPIPWPVPSTGPTNKSNTSGFAGVHLLNNRRGKPRAWSARTRVGRVTQSKLFPIAKYGYAKAKELAIAERQRQLEKVAQTADLPAAANGSRNR